MNNWAIFVEHDNGTIVLVTMFFAIQVALRRVGWLAAACWEFPATVLHELCHFVVGLVLLAKPVAFNVFPQKGHIVRRGVRRSVTMYGSVSFANLNMINGMFVSLAPLLLIPVAAFTYYEWPVTNLVQNVALKAYLLFVVLAASVPSFKDLELGCSVLNFMWLFALFFFFSVAF